MTLTIGSPAPEFELPASSGERISLAALRGKKVMLVFYPFAFSGICTGELCEIRDRALDFSADDTVVLGVSCDPVPALTAFAASESYRTPLLSDFWPHGEVSREYGVFVEHVGASNRGTFVIDREGVLRWSVVTELGKARNSDDYVSALNGIA